MLFFPLASPYSTLMRYMYRKQGATATLEMTMAFRRPLPGLLTKCCIKLDKVSRNIFLALESLARRVLSRSKCSRRGLDPERIAAWRTIFVGSLPCDQWQGCQSTRLHAGRNSDGL